ncbi:MAG: hypothetical protein ACYC7E_11355 [Armatimonadota bacterium]
MSLTDIAKAHLQRKGQYIQEQCVDNHSPLLEIFTMILHSRINLHLVPRPQWNYDRFEAVGKHTTVNGKNCFDILACQPSIGYAESCGAIIHLLTQVYLTNFQIGAISYGIPSEGQSDEVLDQSAYLAFVILILCEDYLQGIIDPPLLDEDLYTWVTSPRILKHEFWDIDEALTEAARIRADCRCDRV